MLNATPAPTGDPFSTVWTWPCWSSWSRSGHSPMLMRGVGDAVDVFQVPGQGLGAVGPAAGAADAELVVSGPAGGSGEAAPQAVARPLALQLRGVGEGRDHVGGGLRGDPARGGSGRSCATCARTGSSSKPTLNGLSTTSFRSRAGDTTVPNRHGLPGAMAAGRPPFRPSGPLRRQRRRTPESYGGALEMHDVSGSGGPSRKYLYLVQS
jgi:hypothetical protein